MQWNNSRLQQFLSCPMSYKHRYINGAVLRKRPTYFVLGEAIHKFIEMWYRTQDKTMALKSVENVFAKVNTSLLNAEESHDFQVDLQIALGIACAYPEYYKQDFDTYKKFLTEQKFELKLENGEIYYGTLDALMMDHAGDWWILETKTAAPSTVSADYFERVRIDSQVSGYMHGAKQITGSFPRGIVYNVIKKPAIRLKSGESYQAFQQRVYHEYTKLAKEKQYFTREELIVGTTRLEEWLHDTTQLVGMLKDKIVNKDKWWHKNTGNCRANYGTCDYLPACVARAYNKLIYEKEENPK